MIGLPTLALVTIALLALGYVVYGRFVARRLGPDPAAATPAERLRDDRDFVPTGAPYLLGQHFSAIAAAGPIAGPIIACSQFGWLPTLLWVVFGVVLIGAVHDFTALFASVRHDGRSIAEIARQHVGARAATLLLVFIWVSLVYVVMAFTDITAATFTGATEELAGEHAFDPGGAVALAAALYLGLAVLMGGIQRRFRPPLWALTLVFVPATLASVWVGTQASTLLVFSQGAWNQTILVYCVVASLLPVWSLLQPRGYLGGFVLYLALFFGMAGVLFGGFEIGLPATTGAPLFGLDGSPLFPFLFVTVACGACSGFHGLVCSGTTSKQVANEAHCRPIGYGAMLLEAFVALIALATALVATRPGDAPGTIYGDGLGRFIVVLIGEEHLRVARTFGTMAFSTFVFDTLDVAVRLGRYIVQELFRWRGRTAAVLATLLTVAAPALLLAASEPGSWRHFWHLFGTSNQLLAALTLLALTLWLKRTGKAWGFTFWPMLFIGAVTIAALLLQARTHFRAGFAGDGIGWLPVANGCAAVLLLGLALAIAREALRAARRPASAPREPA